MRSFIIHMSSSTARHPNASKLCASLPDAELVEAVDGRDTARSCGVDVRPGTLHRPHYPFALRPAEIGVFESHRNCWQRIVDERLDYALVSEDDLAIDPVRFDRALKLISANATPDMVIRLPVKQRERPARVLAEDGDMALILPKTIGLQCICQVVGRNAAQRLLDVTASIDRPVDTLLQMHWITGQPVHALLGTGNQEVAQQIGGSTIQVKTAARGKLTREFRRAVYRAKLALHPQTS